MSVDEARQVAARLLESFFRELGEEHVNIAIQDCSRMPGHHVALIHVGKEGTPEEKTLILHTAK